MKLWRPQSAVSIIAGTLVLHRVAITVGAGLVAVVMAWLAGRAGPLFYTYAIFDLVLSLVLAPMTFTLGWRYVSAYALTAIGWFAGAWWAAPMLTRLAGL